MLSALSRVGKGGSEVLRERTQEQRQRAQERNGDGGGMQRNGGGDGEGFVERDHAVAEESVPEAVDEGLADEGGRDFKATEHHGGGRSPSLSRRRGGLPGW